MLHLVYVLQCNDDRYYTGLTNNLNRRLAQHKRGEVISTKHKRPVKLLFFAGFTTRSLAAEFEKYLKSHSGSAFRNKHLISSL